MKTALWNSIEGRDSSLLSLQINWDHRGIARVWIVSSPQPMWWRYDRLLWREPPVSFIGWVAFVDLGSWGGKRASMFKKSAIWAVGEVWWARQLLRIISSVGTPAMIQTPMVSTVRNHIISRIGQTACDYFWICAVRKRSKEQKLIRKERFAISLITR